MLRMCVYSSPLCGVEYVSCLIRMFLRSAGLIGAQSRRDADFETRDQPERKPHMAWKHNYQCKLASK
jgi:hypothetical protein